MKNNIFKYILVASTIAIWLSACESKTGSDNGSFKLLSMVDVTAYANEEIKISIDIANPPGNVTFSYSLTDADCLDGGSSKSECERNDLGQLDKQDNSRARFKWTPLSIHAGQSGTSYEAVFRAESNGTTVSEKIIIQINTSDGRPTFKGLLSHHIELDDAAADKFFNFEICVQDDDSVEVELSLGANAPEGMSLTKNSKKCAQLNWTPTPDQIALQTWWQVSVLADDGNQANPTEQLFDFILLTNQECDIPALDLQHSPITDQPAQGDITIEWDVFSDKLILQSYLVYCISDIDSACDDNNIEDLVACLYEPDGEVDDCDFFKSSDDFYNFELNIPNPGDGKKVWYGVCVYEDSDTTDNTVYGQCDLVKCLPGIGVDDWYTFNVSDSCVDDMYDGATSSNDDKDTAVSVTAVLQNLTICPNNEDWFSTDVESGASIKFSSTAQAMTLYNELAQVIGEEQSTETGISIIYTNETGSDETVYALITATESAGRSYEVNLEALAGAGGIVITEIMFNPEQVNDPSKGEWIEILNTGSSTIDISGWTIKEGTDNPSLLVTAPTTGGATDIPGGEYRILSASTSFESEVGVSVDFSYEYSKIKLNNSEDVVVLIDGQGQTVDSVTYKSTSASTPGHSYQLDPQSYTETDPADKIWCHTPDTESINPKDAATPSTINVSCP